MRSKADPTSPPAPSPTGATLLAASGSTFLLTLANPATILSFIAVFAGFGLGHIPGYSSAFALVAGVFLGSLIWWLILSQGVSLFSSRFTPGWIQGINRISGGVLIGFGVAAVLAAWRH